MVLTMRRGLLHSQKKHRPSESPDMTYRWSGEKLTWHAYPAVLCPLKVLFFRCLKRSFAVYVMICAGRSATEGSEAGGMSVFRRVSDVPTRGPLHLVV